MTPPSDSKRSPLSSIHMIAHDSGGEVRSCLVVIGRREWSSIDVRLVFLTSISMSCLNGLDILSERSEKRPLVLAPV